jgi:anaerobic sulfite reductase subunit C
MSRPFLCQKKGYRVLVGGKLGRHPRLAEEIPGIFSKDDALRVVEKCLDLYQERSVHGERLGEILERMGKRQLERRKSDEEGKSV